MTATARSAGTAGLIPCIIIHSHFSTTTVSNEFTGKLLGNMAAYAAKAIPYFYVLSSKPAGFARCSNSGVQLEQVDWNIFNSPKRPFAGWAGNGDNWVDSGRDDNG